MKTGLLTQLLSLCFPLTTRGATVRWRVPDRVVCLDLCTDRLLALRALQQVATLTPLTRDPTILPSGPDAEPRLLPP